MGKIKIIVVLNIFLTLSAFAGADSGFTDTDLGKAGNRRVAEIFQNYQLGKNHCGVSKDISGRRVLLTGFGRFGGNDENFSGVVAHALGDERYGWENSSQAPALPAVPTTANGAWAGAREIFLDGEKVSLCTLYLDVQWDLAAAIILEEANRFSPEFILMTGLGGSAAVFEGAVQNSADGLAGYGPGGENLGAANAPACPKKNCTVLPPADPGVTPYVNLSWNNEELARAARPFILAVAPSIEVLFPRSADPGNDYVCNNVSYVVEVARRAPVRLAGGRIRLGLNAPVAAVGFLHYPNFLPVDSATVFGWAKALSAVIKTALAKNI